MGYKIVAPPSEEPVTLAEAKARLSISDSLDDTDIDSLIAAAREQAESYTGRSFVTQSIEMALDHFPAEIELPRGPVQSITSIKYLDADAVLQTLPATDYALDDYSTPPWILPAAGTDWPDTFDASNAIKVIYVAGYGLAADVPADIKQSIYLAVGHWVRFQAEAESGIGPSRMPRQFYDLLGRHRLESFR